MGKQIFIAVALLASPSWSQAQVTTGQWKLAGDQQPTEPALWQRPATVSYARENGKTTGNVDVDLRYAFKSEPSPAPRGWQVNNYAAGIYAHRSTDDSAPKNDRGISLRVSRTYRFGAVDPTAIDAASEVKRIDFLNLSLSAKFGKTLVANKDAAGKITDTYDKKSARLVGQADYYLIPKTVDRPRAPDTQINVAGGAYRDQLSGIGNGSGHLSGVLVKARVDWAFLGLDPNAVRISEGLGFTPTLFAAAQLQKDLANSGARQKARYELYAVGIGMNFARLDSGGLVPSLTLERSTGADLLTGRAKTGKTTLAFGLAF